MPHHTTTAPGDDVLAGGAPGLAERLRKLELENLQLRKANLRAELRFMALERGTPLEEDDPYAAVIRDQLHALREQIERLS